MNGGSPGRGAERSGGVQPRRAVLVTGLSGAGKASVLRVLEDLGHETVDNPPLSVLPDLLSEPGELPLAVGVDARSRGFDATELAARLAALGDAAPQVVFVTADEEILLRRYSETRRRHPLAPGGALGAKVADGIAREATLLAPLRDRADLLLDTSALALPDLRRIIEGRYGGGAPLLSVAVISFAYPRGLPREADLVLDMRFLRNPHYVPELRPLTGRDEPVADYVTADPAWDPFWARMTAMLDPLLPAYAAAGKKYLTVALGCTGGKHRSVLAAERLARHLESAGWPVDLVHREVGARPVPAPGDAPGSPPPIPPLATAPPVAHMATPIMPPTDPGASPDPSGPRASEPRPDPLPGPGRVPQRAVAR